MVHARDASWTGIHPPESASVIEGEEVSAHSFYGEYHGHRVEHLETVHRALCGGAEHKRSVVWLCGDSTLDNKYWLPGFATSRALNGFERVLNPAVMQQDVAYWVNSELAERGLTQSVCLNCSVEESTLADRANGRLLPQDEFIRDHLQPSDVLVVSVGGNDIALRPSLKTILSIVGLMASPRSLLESGWAPGMSHILHLFGARTRDLITNLCSRCPGGGPRCVVVCMLYYLDEAQTPSWAARTLSALGYDKDPTKLQLLIRKAFEEATQRIQLPGGVRVVPLPLFEALDGKDPSDYVQRVEPSAKGGQKMARALIDRIHGVVTGQ